ncbi:MAG: DUF1631 domain-containing protein [Chromatiales bacterium]|jgi:hypothetical protein
MPEGDNITDLMHSAAAARRMHLSDASRRIVEDCRRITSRALPLLLAGLFEKLDDALFDMADKSDRNALQTVYFDVMREVRKSRVRIEHRFMREVTEGFDAFWASGRKSPGGPATVAEADMALVEEEDLEETLAVSNMVSKGESLYRREIYVLGERFSHLANGFPVDPRSNPLGPFRLCAAFRGSVSMLNVEVPVKLVIYKLFDKQVMRYVGGMYDELNARLSAAGVLPKLTPKARRNPVEPAATERAGTSAHRETGEPGGGPASGRAGDDVLGTLRGLLDRRREGGGSPDETAAGAGTGSPPVDAGELVAALSSLQEGGIGALEYEPSMDELKPLEIRALLAERFHIGGAKDAERSLGPLEEDVIDVTSMLFELILEDPAIPDALKVPISRLQIPVLKVALMDSSFFSDAAHPARRLLNNLAQASVGWAGEADPERDVLYGRIQSVVDRVLAEFNRDIRIFADLDEEFSAFLEAEHRGAEVAEERASQVVRGKERLAVAKRHVGEQIRHRLEDAPGAPAVVRQIIEEAWKDVMLLIYLRQGGESPEWGSALRVVDDLIWSTEPKASFEERQELLRLIPELLRQLREGLSGISFDQHRMTSLLKELQGVHIASLRPGAAAPEPPAVPRVGQTRVGAWDADEAGRRRDELPRGADLAVGTWLELEGDDGRTRRAKLSWRSSLSDLCVLVDRRGAKILDIELPELAELIREGKARVVVDTDVPLVDRALTALMAMLRGASPPGGTPRA